MWVPLSKLRGVPGSTFKLSGVSRDPGSRGLGPTFTLCLIKIHGNSMVMYWQRNTKLMYLFVLFMKLTGCFTILEISSSGFF